MSTPHVDVLDTSTNYVVVQTEGRRFPGIVVQGDSLKNMVKLVFEAEDALKRGDPVESKEALLELEEELLSRIQHYEEVLTRLGRELPYQQRFLKQARPPEQP